MELSDKQKQKQEAIDCLSRRLTDDVRQRLCEVDERLLAYIDSMARDVSVIFGDENDRHSMWEVLCAAKFIRMFTTYHFNTKKVQFYIAMREGQWERNGKAWRYISGGLRLPSTSGAKVYRWQPFQVFVLSCVFGFYAWVDTHVEAGTKYEMLDTEREKDGNIWDFRRMITEFIMYGPRKIDKTGLSSYIQLIFFLFGDFNSEIYSLAMTSDQSGILFDRTKFMLNQMNKSDEGNPLFRMTAKGVNWLKQYQSELRNSKIVPLTGGGKAPDGTNTELLNWDELGSSPYINGKSDMMAHVNVCQSSMGQRRQPLTFGTTTAGTITSGPFIEKLQAMHDLLLQELKYDTGEATPSQILDTQMCLLLEPDEYEKTEYEYILTSHALRRKINPMLSIVVQYDFYDREMTKARQEGDQKFSECVAKLFNVYQSGRVTKWITGDEMRHLQVERRIDDCTKDQGWVVFTGLDFSLGGDWNGPGWLAARRHPSGRGTEFFADLDVWISEEEYNDSPLHPLYEQWVKCGWMHVSPGKTFQPELFVGRLDELIKKGVQFMFFGYDKYKSKVPINVLKSYLQATLGIQNPEPYVQVVSQLNSEFNGPTEDLYNIMFAPVPFISYSNSPLWPFCFNNAMLETDNRENKRPVKANQSASCKIDPIQCIIMALDLYERYEGARQ
jgi:phage terminase large subunit-like protein